MHVRAAEQEEGSEEADQDEQRQWLGQRAEDAVAPRVRRHLPQAPKGLARHRWEARAADVGVEAAIDELLRAVVREGIVSDVEIVHLEGPRRHEPLEPVVVEGEGTQPREAHAVAAVARARHPAAEVIVREGEQLQVLKRAHATLCPRRVLAGQSLGGVGWAGAGEGEVASHGVGVEAEGHDDTRGVVAKGGVFRGACTFP